MLPFTQDEIRALAKYLWEWNGRPSGMSDEYWKLAEALLSIPKAQIALPETPHAVFKPTAWQVQQLNLFDTRIEWLEGDESFCKVVTRKFKLWVALQELLGKHGMRMGDLNDFIQIDRDSRGNPR